jgi:hypothetical protein
VYIIFQACEAWQKEAEESKRRAKLIEDERIQAYKQRDEVRSYSDV